MTEHNTQVYSEVALSSVQVQVYTLKKPQYFSS